MFVCFLLYFLSRYESVLSPCWGKQASKSTVLVSKLAYREGVLGRSKALKHSVDPPETMKNPGIPKQNLQWPHQTKSFIIQMTKTEAERGKETWPRHTQSEILIRPGMEEGSTGEILGTGKDLRSWKSLPFWAGPYTPAQVVRL